MHTLKFKLSIIALLIVISLIAWLLMPINANQHDISEDQFLESADPIRGENLLSVAGCFACHTDPESGVEEFSGGPALDSPFGIFYASNITPDKETGTGSWTLSDFERAVRQGISPQNYMYYPSMPYTAYSGLTDQDIVDMWVALQRIEPISRESKQHILPFPFNQRILLKPWRLLYFPTFQKPVEDRGEYLVKHVLHCSECHTPRNLLGAQKLSKFLQGNKDLPDENFAPDISKDSLHNSNWSRDDMELLLSIGMLTDGDFVGGSMTEVVDYGTSQLSADDLSAISQYLMK